MKVQEAIELGTNMIRQNKEDEARFIVKTILSFYMKKDMSYLLIHNNEELEEHVETKVNDALQKILNGIPLQYIINEQYFMGIKFYVDTNVLIPQPDTEVLVEEVLSIIKNENKLNILDLCTGSGAIAVSLAKNANNIQIIATDISKKAIKIAQKNAEDNFVNVNFIQSDLFDEIKEKFDIIVSNPPYIETETIKSLSKEVQYEPHIALDGGKDGLDFYRKIARDAKKYLNENGYLALEIGYNQKEKVIEILEKEGYEEIYAKKDLSNNDRIVVGKK